MPKTMQSQFLQTIEARGFVQDYTDKDALDALLANGEKSGKPLVAYIGFDCTAPSLHVGSLIQIMILRHFQKAGHKPIVLMGGGTTKVGDPSGKDESRQLLDESAIEKNKDAIKQVFTQFLDFEEKFDTRGSASAFEMKDDSFVILSEDRRPAAEKGNTFNLPVQSRSNPCGGQERAARELRA